MLTTQNHTSRIRLIHQKDNKAIKTLVLNVLAEFGLVGEGYAGVDPEMDDMYAAYDNDLSAYYVVELSGNIEGVGGFAPLAGTESGTVAELRKMYLTQTVRGQGMGKLLIEKCIQGAKSKGYETMYLETVPGMKAAQNLYVKNGFKYLDQRMGNTGHNGCQVLMAKSLHA